MRRRNFIKLSSATSISAAFFPLLNCTNPKKSTLPENFELSETTITVLQDKMKSGDLTSRKITQMYLDEIAKIDKAGPN